MIRYNEDTNTFDIVEEKKYVPYPVEIRYDLDVVELGHRVKQYLDFEYEVAFMNRNREGQLLWPHR